MALQKPQISFSLINGNPCLSGINGGSNSSYSDNGYYLFYGYKIYNKDTGLELLDITTDSTSFTVDLTGLVTSGTKLVVKQYQCEDYGEGDKYTFSNESNIAIVTVKARPPVVNYSFETGLVNIKTELEPHHASLDPVSFIIKLFGNGVLIQDIPTSSLDYNYPLIITENTVLYVVIQNADGSMSSPSEPKRITYTDSPQAASFEVVTPFLNINAPVISATAAMLSPTVTTGISIVASDVLQFLDSLNPGDELIIDLAKATATLNGVNVLDQMDGVLDWALMAGLNRLKIEDGSASRNLKVSIEWREKYL